MNKFTIFIITSLIYQAAAGGPSVTTTTANPPTSTTLPKCISCEEVFKNGKPLSPANCDPGTSPKVGVTIGYRNSNDPPTIGACAGPHAGVTTGNMHETIEDVNVDDGHLEFP